jgi:hypothetical protein
MLKRFKMVNFFIFQTAKSGDPHTHIIQRVEPTHEGLYTCVAGNGKCNDTCIAGNGKGNCTCVAGNGKCNDTCVAGNGKCNYTCVAGNVKCNDTCVAGNGKLVSVITHV